MLLMSVSTGCFALKTNEDDYAIVKGKKIFLKIADTPEKQLQGLMYVKQMPENYGMIFLFDNAEPRSFWMKNTEIPLDIIFLRNRKIINIHRNVRLDNQNKNRTYQSAYKSDCAIEVNAGFCDRYNVQVGDFVLLGTGVKDVWGRIKETE
jgi:hypothetical protein